MKNGRMSACALSAPVQTYRFNTNHPVLKVLKLTPRQGTPMRAHKRPPESAEVPALRRGPAEAGRRALGSLAGRGRAAEYSVI